MIAFVAKYYGTSPLIVEAWKTTEINEWHNEAAKMENEKSKAAKSASDGKKS